MHLRRNLILGAVLAILLAAPTVADTMMSGRAFAWDKAEVTAAADQIEAWVVSATPVKLFCDRLAHKLKR